MATERSPNYPFIGLGMALKGVRQLWDKERRSPVTSEMVAKAFGHTALSGPATSKVAAVRQYGLLDQVSHGKYKVSDATITLMLKKPGDPEYDSTIRSVALTPSLFAELYSNNPEASDDNLRYLLEKERKFSTDGAARVIRSYRETLSVAKLDSKSYINTDGEVEGEFGSSAQDEESDTIVDRARGARGAPRQDAAHRAPEVDGVAYSWPLGSGTSVQLIFSSEPTQKNIEVLLAQLKIVRDIAPTEAAPILPSDKPDAQG